LRFLGDKRRSREDLRGEGRMFGMGNISLNKIIPELSNGITDQFSRFGIIVVSCYTTLSVAVLVALGHAKALDLYSILIFSAITVFMYSFIVHYVSRSSGHSISKALSEHAKKVEEITSITMEEVRSNVLNIMAAEEVNSKKISALMRNTSKTLMLTALSYRGKVDISKMEEFYDIWTDLMSIVESSFYAVNYLDIRQVNREEFRTAAATLVARKKFHKIRVHRIYFADDEDEIPAIIAAAQDNSSFGYTESYVKTNDLERAGVFEECGLSDSKWDKGFVIIDDAAVAIFEMKDRMPVSFEISVNSNTVEAYKNLFEMVEGLSEKRLASS
jgi:hypothetical protein